MKPLILHADGTLESPYSLEERAFFQGWQPTTRGTVKDVAESARVARLIRAIPKQCWFNARKTVLKLADYAAASYIEGWVVIRNMPIEHAWIVSGGKIIDPTLPSDLGVYFPGLEFQGRSGIEEFLRTRDGKKCKKTAFFYAFGWGGMESPSFRKCYEDAMAYLQRLCAASQ